MPAEIRYTLDAVLRAHGVADLFLRTLLDSAAELVQAAGRDLVTGEDVAEALEGIGGGDDGQPEPEAGAAGRGRLDGPIRAGDRLIWEPRDPKAYAQVTVVAVRTNEDGESWVETEDEKGGRHWNTEDRVREVCVRDERPGEGGGG